MKTTDAERLRKVQALYDRATSPGEKAAAFEALTRIRENVGRWKDDILKVLERHGFWKYIIAQNQMSFVRIFRVEYVEIYQHKVGGTWTYILDDRHDGKRFTISGTDSESLERELNKRKKT